MHKFITNYKLDHVTKLLASHGRNIKQTKQDHKSFPNVITNDCPIYNTLLGGTMAKDIIFFLEKEMETIILVTKLFYMTV